MNVSVFRYINKEIKIKATVLCVQHCEMWNVKCAMCLLEDSSYESFFFFFCQIHTSLFLKIHHTK